VKRRLIPLLITVGIVLAMMFAMSGVAYAGGDWAEAEAEADG